jgi:glycosyltransferase involved in cell wall biosynthesis
MGQSFSMNDSDHKPLIGIVMCTFNGGKFLQGQLDSISHQSYQYWKLYVSDDGSNDDTLEILSKFASQCAPGQVIIFDGPRHGFAKNFLSMLAREEVVGDFIAFSDQDDVWLEDKLEYALNTLQVLSEKIPALHCSRTNFIDENSCVLGSSTLFAKPPSFPNALVQSIGGGNTMMINKATLNILRPLSSSANVFSHDWWIYLVVTALGGSVIYTPKPLVLYRQHSQNVMGMNTSLSQKWRRIRMLWSGDFRRWNDLNILDLQALYPQMDSSIKLSFDNFIQGRQKGLLGRLYLMKKSGIYRQTLLGNLGLLFAVVFNKI